MYIGVFVAGASPASLHLFDDGDDDEIDDRDGDDNNDDNGVL